MKPKSSQINSEFNSSTTATKTECLIVNKFLTNVKLKSISEEKQEINNLEASNPKDCKCKIII